MEMRKRRMLKGEQLWIEWKKAHPRKQEVQEPPVLHSKLLHDWIDTGLGPDYEIEWGIGRPIPGAKQTKKAKK